MRIEMLTAVLKVVSDIDRLTRAGQGPLTPTGKGGERTRPLCVSSEAGKLSTFYSPITDSQVKVPEEMLGLLALLVRI